MGSGVECSSLQLIDGNGTFNAARLDNFINQVKLAQCGVSYVVVSIMGPQSSGKSTLLNHLFGTNFKEMNALVGKSQTTQGIWLANCVGIEPCTLVMDVEGTDGRERGQDDTTFEKQSALFSLVVSDIVLLNMWCNEIGREQASNKPLLRTVFQVMMTLFSPRRVTLMFVIRDKSKTPLEILERDLKNDIQMLWDSIPKPQATSPQLSEFFNVKVVALSSYEANEELFKEEVASLRQQFCDSITPGRLAGDRRGVVPASGFSLSAQHMWGIIKDNKDLNLPKHRVMVATVRCEEISREKFAWFSQNEDWCKIENDVRHGIVSDFGGKVHSLINTCLSEYDTEAAFYDECVKNENQKKLEEKLMLHVQSAYKSMMKHIKSTTLLEFRKAFAQAVDEQKELLPVAVSNCTLSSMTEFDKRCVGNDADSRLADLGTYNKKIRDKLQHEIDGIAERTSKILVKAELTSIITTGTIKVGASIGSVAVGEWTGVTASAGVATADLIGTTITLCAKKKAIKEILKGSGCRYDEAE